MGLQRIQQPIIVGITGHAVKEYFEKGLKAGMDKMVAKPLYIYDFKKLLQGYGMLN